MRIFIAFENAVHPVDVSVGETVGDIKNLLRQRFSLNLKNSQNENDSFVSLVHQGSSLQDNWIYSDLGIPAGTTLICRVEKRVEPTLTVICDRYDEAIEYKESFRVWQTLVATLRVMIQNSTGIHVSAFRLYSAAGLELFDCHPLKVYGIHVGDTVTMEIWHDVEDLVQAARTNDITDTLQALASFHEAPYLMRYQLQLGLFTAAHFGYHQLATQLIKYGARPNEPVGQHPSRDWCRAAAHPDHMKTPSHEAAQHGRLTCLHHFLMFNYSVLICKDAHGLTPCNVARRYKQTECFKLLIAEQFRIPTVSDLSIHVYSRVRKWCDRARSRARLHKDKTSLLLLSNAEVAQKGAIVGQRVEVDGYKATKQEDNGNINRDGRRTKSTASASSSGIAKSNVHKYNRHTIKENNRNTLEREPRLSCSASSQVVMPKEGVIRSRDNSTRSTHAYCRQTTKSTSVKPRVLPVRISRGPTTLSGKRLATAEMEGAESKGRYVWKSLQSTTDQPTDWMGNDKGNHRAIRQNEGRSGTIQRYDKKGNREIFKENEGRSGTSRTPKSHDHGITHVHDVENDTTEHENLETKRSNEQRYRSMTETSRSANNEWRMRISSISSGKQPRTFSLDRSESCDHVSRSVDSADKCLRVASETFRRKSWLGQLQMALVVSTNMCKRRQNELKQQVEVLEPGIRLEPYE